MKALKYLFVAMLPLGFMACNEDEDDKVEDFTTAHTQLQKDAQAYFQGEWVATPAKKLYNMMGQSVYAQVVFADTICFDQAYSTPKVFYRNDYLKGETYNFTAYGECTYKPETIGETTVYYYYVSPNADEFALYHKDSETLYQTYKLTFDNESKFTLNGSAPYVFNKNK